MSIARLIQYIRQLFQPTVMPQASGPIEMMPIRRRASRAGKPSTPRQRQRWLDAELEKIKGAGQYVVVPPKEMNLELAQCRLSARLTTKLGRGSYKTRQLAELHSIHVTVL